jgi:hypothetical protein
LTENNINRKFNIRLKQLKYNSLVSAIPPKWKKKLKLGKTELLKIILDHDCRLEINKIKKEISEVTTKDIYTILLNKTTKRATSEQKWMETELLDIKEDDWANIYQSAFKLTTETKI